MDDATRRDVILGLGATGVTVGLGVNAFTSNQATKNLEDELAIGPEGQASNEEFVEEYRQAAAETVQEMNKTIVDGLNESDHLVTDNAILEAGEEIGDDDQYVISDIVLDETRSMVDTIETPRTQEEAVNITDTGAKLRTGPESVDSLEDLLEEGSTKSFDVGTNQMNLAVKDSHAYDPSELEAMADTYENIAESVRESYSSATQEEQVGYAEDRISDADSEDEVHHREALVQTRNILQGVGNYRTAVADSLEQNAEFLREIKDAEGQNLNVSEGSDTASGSWYEDEVEVERGEFADDHGYEDESELTLSESSEFDGFNVLYEGEDTGLDLYRAH